MVLDVSGNGMGGEEIETLLDLYRLETLNLANNDIQEISQVWFYRLMLLLLLSHYIFVEIYFMSAVFDPRCHHKPF